MWLDSIHGIIERRILLNYRVDPGALQRVLPRPFRPKLYQGYGVGGIFVRNWRFPDDTLRRKPGHQIMRLLPMARLEAQATIPTVL